MYKIIKEVLIMYIVLFDSYIRTKKGLLPFYEESFVDEAHDQELIWFHESYGCMKLYRLHQADDTTFIAEDLKRMCSTSHPNWGRYSEHPELAIQG